MRTPWERKPKHFVYKGLQVEILKFCKLSIKARLDYIKWSKEQNEKTKLL